MDIRNNNALIELSRAFLMDGDWMKCRSCGNVLIASRDGEVMRHKDGCKFGFRVHPWTELRTALTIGD